MNRDAIAAGRVDAVLIEEAAAPVVQYNFGGKEHAV